MLNWIYKSYVKLFAKQCFIRLNHLLFNLAIRGLGVFNFQDDLSGEFNFVRKYFGKRSGEKLVIFDVGANVGKYSSFVLENIESVDLFAFEPHPATFKILNDRLGSLSNVKLLNVAL